MTDPLKLSWVKKLGEQVPALALFVLALALMLYYLNLWIGVAFEAQSHGLEVLHSVQRSVDANTAVLTGLAEKLSEEQRRREHEHEVILQELHNDK